MTIFGLKMIVKSGLDFFFEIPLAPLEILLINQANSVFLGSFFCNGHQQLWWGAQNFKKKILDHFLPSFSSQKWSFQDLRF